MSRKYLTLNIFFVLFLYTMSASMEAINVGEWNGVQIVSKFSGECIQADRSVAAKIRPAVCNDKEVSQLFGFAQVGNGVFTIASAAGFDPFSSGCLRRGFPVAQRWVIEPQGRDWVRFRVKDTDTCLDLHRKRKPVTCGFETTKCDSDRSSQLFNFQGGNYEEKKDTVVVRGHIKDATNNQLISSGSLRNANIKITFKVDGESYEAKLLDGSIYEVELAKGEASITVTADGYSTDQSTKTITQASDESHNENDLLIVKIVPGWRIILTWAAKPVDLDLSVVIKETGETIAYNHVTSNDGKGHFDVDATRGFGPETVTLKDIDEGHYIIKVRNYDYVNDVHLNKSHAKIKVIKDSQTVGEYAITTAEAPKSYDWHAATIDAEAGTIEAVNKLIPRS